MRQNWLRQLVIHWEEIDWNSLSPCQTKLIETACHQVRSNSLGQLVIQETKLIGQLVNMQNQIDWDSMSTCKAKLIETVCQYGRPTWLRQLVNMQDKIDWDSLSTCKTNLIATACHHAIPNWLRQLILWACLFLSFLSNKNNTFYRAKQFCNISNSADYFSLPTQKTGMIVITAVVAEPLNYVVQYIPVDICTFISNVPGLALFTGETPALNTELQ